MLIVAAVIVFYIPFLAESLINRTIVLAIYVAVVLVVYRAYGRDYFKRHPKEHRIRIIIASGALTAITTMILLSALSSKNQCLRLVSGGGLDFNWNLRWLHVPIVQS